MSELVNRIKKMHEVRSIEKKDLSLKDFFTGKTTETMLEIVGLSSKFVPKYEKNGNPGYHTMIYLADGRKTGAFSAALLEFANFFYEAAGMDTTALFNRIDFAGVLKVWVSKVNLDEGKTTYNFNIDDQSTLTGATSYGALKGSGPILIEAAADE